MVLPSQIVKLLLQKSHTVNLQWFCLHKNVTLYYKINRILNTQSISLMILPSPNFSSGFTFHNLNNTYSVVYFHDALYSQNVFYFQTSHTINFFNDLAIAILLIRICLDPLAIHGLRVRSFRLLRSYFARLSAATNGIPCAAA